MMSTKINLRPLLLVLVCLTFGQACQNFNDTDDLTPDSGAVIASGSDLQRVLNRSYARWWRAVHDAEPALGLGVAGDAFALGLDNLGTLRLGEEPRVAYNNRTNEPDGYRAVVEKPWYGCLGAVADANDILRAMDEGISLDKGGPQDQSIRAAAHLLRGLCWGYLGLLFDEVIVVDEQTDLNKPLDFVPYQAAIGDAITELDKAIDLADAAGVDFIHDNFNGILLDEVSFQALCNSYAARFLAQFPRTLEENLTVDWDAVLMRAEAGMDTDFAPLADGEDWVSYHRYIFAETGEGPFWARVDQRLVAAMDPSQPARYPEVEARGEAPLTETEATSDDARLEQYFVYIPFQAFPAENGEWHFSHYQYNRNLTEPSFAGDGKSGPMPTFISMDTDLLRAEALMRLGRIPEAIALVNSGSRTTKGNLAPLPALASASDVEEAILYERAIELLGAAPFGLWLDRRRLRDRELYTELTALGGLQVGTPAQLPVPQAELNVTGLAPYNFGGEADPMGIERVY